MNDIIETQTGIFEFITPQEVNASEWMENHLDCDTIMDDKGQTLIVYAFTMESKYNSTLADYRKKKYGKHYILKGISSNALNSLL